MVVLQSNSHRATERLLRNATLVVLQRCLHSIQTVGGTPIGTSSFSTVVHGFLTGNVVPSLQVLEVLRGYAKLKGLL